MAKAGANSPRPGCKNFGLRDLPNQLHHLLKVRAAVEQVSLNALIIRACGEYLKQTLKEDEEEQDREQKEKERINTELIAAMQDIEENSQD